MSHTLYKIERSRVKKKQSSVEVKKLRRWNNRQTLRVKFLRETSLKITSHQENHGKKNSQEYLREVNGEVVCCQSIWNSETSGKKWQDD